MLSDEQSRGLLVVFERAKQLGFIGRNADFDFEVSHSLKFGRVAFEVLSNSKELKSLKCLDIGSGGGLPALVVSVAWKQPFWTLCEISTRRCDFLEWAIRHLDVSSRTTICNTSIEVLADNSDHQDRYDIVTVRAFAPVPEVLDVSLSLVKASGFLLISNPPLEKTKPGHQDIALAEPRIKEHRAFENISVFVKA